MQTSTSTEPAPRPALDLNAEGRAVRRNAILFWVKEILACERQIAGGQYPQFDENTRRAMHEQLSALHALQDDLGLERSDLGLDVAALERAAAACNARYAAEEDEAQRRALAKRALWVDETSQALVDELVDELVAGGQA